MEENKEEIILKKVDKFIDICTSFMIFILLVLFLAVLPIVANLKGDLGKMRRIVVIPQLIAVE